MGGRCSLVERTNEAEIGDAKVWQLAIVAQLRSDVAPKEPLIALKSLQMGTLTFVSAVHDHGERFRRAPHLPSTAWVDKHLEIKQDTGRDFASKRNFLDWQRQ